jgi:phage gp29-like protein
MKNLFQTTLALCFFIIGLASLQAQVPAKAKAAAASKAASKANQKQGGDTPEKVAEELCNCFNNYFNQYHPIIKGMISDMAVLGEEKALENFQEKFLKLSEKEQQTVLNDANSFSKDAKDSEGEMAKCINIFKTKTSKMSEYTVNKIGMIFSNVF